MSKPEIGLSMLYSLGRPFKEMAEEIPKTQTNRIELVDEGLHALSKRRVRLLNSLACSYDIEYAVHAPFAGINISLRSPPLLSAVLRVLKTSIANASTLHCKMWIFHPGMFGAVSIFYPGVDWSRNLKNVRLIFRYAKDYGVEAAIENLMNPFLLKSVEDFERFFDEVDEDVGLVLDTGHANLIGQVGKFIECFPTRLVHVHAHDNLGKADQHLGIGHGNIDWDSFAGLLKKVAYERTVVIESCEDVVESVHKMKQLLG